MKIVRTLIITLGLYLISFFITFNYAFSVLRIDDDSAYLFSLLVFIVLEIPIFACIVVNKVKKLLESREQPAPPPAAEETAEETDE